MIPLPMSLGGFQVFHVLFHAHHVKSNFIPFHRQILGRRFRSRRFFGARFLACRGGGAPCPCWCWAPAHPPRNKTAKKTATPNTPVLLSILPSKFEIISFGFIQNCNLFLNDSNMQSFFVARMDFSPGKPAIPRFLVNLTAAEEPKNGVNMVF